MHVTSRWTSIISEIIPFGPSTHHALGTGEVIQHPTQRYMLPHPSDILNTKVQKVPVQ